MGDEYQNDTLVTYMYTLSLFEQVCQIMHTTSMIYSFQICIVYNLFASVYALVLQRP